MNTPLAFDPESVDALAVKAKRELRKRMRQVRGAVPVGARAARSAEIARNVMSLDGWKAARTVALFVAMDDEVQTGALIEHARREGKRVALPVAHDDTRVLTFRAPYDREPACALVTSAFGVQEPGEDAPLVAPESVDLVVVPALAIDPRGHRLGYGAGYYDHTIGAPAMLRALRVGVAFDFQLLAELPLRAGDQPVDWVVTDRRVTRADPARERPA